MIKDQIQYRSQSLLNLARSYFTSQKNRVIALTEVFLANVSKHKAKQGLRHKMVFVSSTETSQSTDLKCFYLHKNVYL